MKERTYYYFSYGSNNLEQLAERVGRIGGFEHERGIMKNHVRIFAGYSKRWEGGIASFYPAKGKNLDGVIVHMTKSELEKLDKFEGGYTRIRKRVYVASRPVSYVIAYVYLKTNQVFSYMPSSSYLQAIHRNIHKDSIPIYGVLPESNAITRQGTWKKNKGVVIKKS